MTIPGYTNPETPRVKAAAKDSSTGHYYTYKDGAWHPLYEEGKDFGLRDARKVKAAGGVAVPSVTTVLNAAAKPQLTRWLMAQAAGAAWDLMSENAGVYVGKDDIVDAAVDRAQNVSKGAMELGTRIHKAIEDAVGGRDWDADLNLYVDAVMREREKLGITKSNPEQCVGSLELGVAGRCDDWVDEVETGNSRTVIDYKSRKSTGSGKKVPSYDHDVLQLSFYGFCLFGQEFFNNGRAHVVAISTTTPGLVTVHTFLPEDLRKAFEAFKALAAYWRYTNNYDPRK